MLVKPSALSWHMWALQSGAICQTLRRDTSENEGLREGLEANFPLRCGALGIPEAPNVALGGLTGLLRENRDVTVGRRRSKS